MKVAVKRKYVGIDLRKRTYTLAIVGNNGKVTKSNGKTATIEGRQALYKKLKPADNVALEARNPAFIMAKELGLVSRGCICRGGRRGLGSLPLFPLT